MWPNQSRASTDSSFPKALVGNQPTIESKAAYCANSSPKLILNQNESWFPKHASRMVLKERMNMVVIMGIKLMNIVIAIMIETKEYKSNVKS